MNAATPAEWLTVAAISTALYLPFVAVMFAAGSDLPNVSLDGARDAAERVRLVLALGCRLETEEISR
ncbi:hypothetical protein [Streptomyces hirsutus]|uniref:hypothetical protein n=1 Tax=Streptomyces hirsutus TaxID=35620 RepID=UPI0036A8AE1A